MSKKFKIHEFTPTIYPRKLWVCEGGTREDIREAFLDIDRDPLCVNQNIIDNSVVLVQPFAILKETNYLGVIVWLYNDVEVKILHTKPYTLQLRFSKQ